MKELLIHLRTMNLFAHSAHNLVSRVPFNQDHEFFGEIYPVLDDDYDSIAERTIGLMGEQLVNLNEIIAGTAQKLSTLPSTGVKENKVFYTVQLQLEQDLCKLCSLIINKGISEGSKQLLGDICNSSESRQYKIKQRIK